MGQQIRDSKPFNSKKILIVDCGIQNAVSYFDILARNRVGYIQFIQAPDVILSEDVDFDVAVLLCDQTNDLVERTAARVSDEASVGTGVFIAARELYRADISLTLQTSIDAVMKVNAIELFTSQVERMVRVVDRKLVAAKDNFNTDFDRSGSSDLEN